MPTTFTDIISYRLILCHRDIVGRPNDTLWAPANNFPAIAHQTYMYQNTWSRENIRSRWPNELRYWSLRFCCTTEDWFDAMNSVPMGWVRHIIRPQKGSKWFRHPRNKTAAVHIWATNVYSSLFMRTEEISSRPRFILTNIDEARNSPFVVVVILLFLST